MKILVLLVLAATTASMSGCAGTSATDAAGEQSKPASAQARKTLSAFNSEQEMADFFRNLAAESKRDSESRGQASANTATTTSEAQGYASNGAADDEVTNVQHAGVDEGGIVKVHGEHLVVLRRGRLFTVAIGDGALRPVSAVDAFGPDIDPRNGWYDEILVSGDNVAVIGYSYERGGTEVGLFHIDPAGQITYRSTYHLRSNDYYSSRNYASRLIGSKLIFYAPLYISPWATDYEQSFPALRKWHKGAQDGEFKRIVSARRVYRPERPVRADYRLALHTVTVCELSGGEMSCEATAVVGPPGRVFYVSPTSVYVWVTDWWARREGRDSARRNSTLYRMPLDGSAPTALGVSGSPVDQFSFLESADGHLNVLVRSDAAGDGMWRAEVAAGDVALLRVPLESFSDGAEDATASNYRPLPKPEGYIFQNRFVGEYLLYGTGSGWGRPEKDKQSSLYVVRWADGGADELRLPHGVDRIEVMGAGAVVVGTDGRDLHFTSVGLGGRPVVAGSYVRRDASQGELRSHGFFYKPDGPETGMLGLPVQRPSRPGYEHLFENSAAILFLRNESLRLSEVGELAARPEGSSDDACRASCVDWYGNARPLFLRGRVFALLGYELVEGALQDGRMRESRRVSFAPRRQSATLR
ncbi:MAG TPA: beta-propeller domain-containing protein [Pyrinomonadaceae bacterium]|jgi:hypothetical protein